MSDAIEAAIAALCEYGWAGINYDGYRFPMGALREGVRAAIAAYRDSEIEALRAQVEVLQDGGDSLVQGMISIGAGRFEQLRLAELKLADCQTVIRHKGHDADCPAYNCIYCHGRLCLILASAHEFQPGLCSDACGHDRTTREKA